MKEIKTKEKYMEEIKKERKDPEIVAMYNQFLQDHANWLAENGVDEKEYLEEHHDFAVLLARAVLVTAPLVELEMEVAKNRIPEWIEAGKKVFPEEKQDLWAEMVKARARDLYFGEELDAVLKIQECLLQGDFDTAKTVLDDQHGRRYRNVKSMVQDICVNADKFLACIA